MTITIEKCTVQILLLTTILLFFVYLFLNKYVSLNRIPVSIQNYFNSDLRIYCFILTSPKFFDTRARAVNLTWARRCDGYSFISEYSNDTKGLPIATIANITSGYEHLTQKSTLALHYIYKNFLNDYDWFFKGDDDTYLFVENLKLFLNDKNPSQPITFGHNFKVGIFNEFLNPTIHSSLCLFPQDSDYSVDVFKNIDETIFFCLDNRTKWLSLWWWWICSKSGSSQTFLSSPSESEYNLCKRWWFGRCGNRKLSSYRRRLSRKID
jgi:hypothetical protein